MSTNSIIVFHIGGIGDSIHDLAILRQLATACARSKIYYVCQRGNEVLVELAGLGETVVSIPIRNRFGLLFRLAMLPLRASLLVVGCGMVVRKVEPLLWWLCAKKAGASLPDYSEKCVEKMWPLGRTFDELVGPIPGSHRVYVNWRLLQVLGIGGDLAEPLLDLEQISAIPQPDNDAWDLSKPFAIMHHGAASVDSAKRWRDPNWVPVINTITNSYDMNVLIVGGKQEKESSVRIQGQCANKERVYDATGQLTLVELVKAISQATFVVGTDSGPGHIAAAVGTPLVSIFGPTRPSQVAPITERGYVVYHPVSCSPCYWGSNYDSCPNGHMCMELIGGDSIIRAIDLLLSSSAADIVVEPNGDVVARCPTVKRCCDWPPQTLEEAVAAAEAFCRESHQGNRLLTTT